MSNFTSNQLFMLNTTSINSSSIVDIPSFDELLDQLGYEMWQTVVNTFILPLINLVGIGLCSFSLWIFTRSSFEESIFFYYRLLCFILIIHLIHNIPFGILSSPRLFPMMNSYVSSLFGVYYTVASSFLFHFEEVIRMGILLHKMKFFSPFIRKHFQYKPQLVSLAFFLTCLLIDTPLAFSLEPTFFKTYFYPDTTNNVKQFSSFYITSSSSFSQTTLGRLFFTFTTFFLNMFLSLLVGIILNTFSYFKYKSYSFKRKGVVEELQMSSINNRPTTSKEIEQQRQRERTERTLEKNMLYMALTLCSISILSRLIFMASYIYFFLFYSFSNGRLIALISNLIYTLVPTSSIFVFYMFNQMFCDETQKFLGFKSNN